MDQSFNKPSLSKVRLVKPRKKFSNGKPQSTPSSEKIEEKINRWSPFVSKPDSRVSESSSANANAGAFSLGGTNFDAGKFVFGSGGPNLSRNSSCWSAGSFDSVMSEEGVRFVFGSGMEKNYGSRQESSLGLDEGLVFSKLPDEMRKMDLKSSGSGYYFEKKRQVENGFVVGGSSVSSGNYDAEYFVFGGGVKKSVDLSQNSSIGSDKGSFAKLPDEIKNLNLKGSGNVDDVEKKKQAENVFVFGGVLNVPGSTGSVSGLRPINAGSGIRNTRSMSFGSEGSESGVKKNDVPSRESLLGSDDGLVFSKLPDEMRKMDLKGSVSGDDFEKKRQVENGFVFGTSVNSGNSDAGYFVFGGGVEKGVDLSWNSVGSDMESFSELPDEFRNLNLKGSANVNDFEKKVQAENGPVFGGSMDVPGSTGSISGSQPINVGSEKPNARSVSFGNSDEGVFIFGSGTNKSADASGLEKGSFSKLSEEMRMLNLKNSGNVDDFEKNKQAENVFVFGGSKTGSRSTGSVSGSQPVNVGLEKLNTRSSSFGSEGSGNSDEGVFIFGKLPDEMRRLNLKNFDNVDEFEKNKQAENVFVFGGSMTCSGSNVNKIPESSEFVSFHGAASGSKPINVGKKKPSVVSFSFGSEGSGNSDANDFAFGNVGKRSADLSRNSSVGFDEGLFCKLPDEMRKMNLTSDDGFEKLKTDNAIRFGGNRDATGSFSCGVANKVTEETGKLNLGRETATQNVKNETVESVAGAFVFGSSTEKSSVSSFDNGTAFKFPIGNKFNTQCLEKDRETGHREKVDGGNSFVFGTSDDTSASLGGSCNNILHDEMGKLNSGTNTEKLAGSVPFEFAFQGGKQDHRSNLTSIPSSPAPDFQYTGPVFSFTGKPLGLGTPQMKFKTPKQDAAPLTKETLFTGTYQNTPFNAKKSDAKKTKPKKKRDKPRTSAAVYQNVPTLFVSEESDPQVNPEVDPTGGYSPMDYSPYHEELVADQYLREPSVASEDSIHFFSHGASTDTLKTVSGDEQEEVLVSEAQRLNISEGNLHQGEVGDIGSEDLVKRNSNAEPVFLDEQTDKFGNGSNMSKHENVDMHNDARTSAMDAEAGFFCSNMGRPAREGGTEFTFSSSLGDLGESNFKFAASPSVQGPLPVAKQTYRRKNRLKYGQNPSVSTTNARVSLTSPLPDLIPRVSTSGLPDSVGQKTTSSAPRSEDEWKTGKSKESNARQESTSSVADSVPAQEACEKWRFRGNQAYANGHMTKAEDYYTRGVNSVSLKEIPSSCIKPLSLCYSNRAATRMSLGKWREALNDCKMAVSLDPDFLKARVRVANCHLALGEIGEALNHFKKCLQSENDIRSDQKYIIEASNGLQKAQLVADLTGQSAELLLRKTSNDASKAINMISEALSISPHSESLLEMKAEALLVMRNYEDVIMLCEQTLDLAEQNSVVTESNSQFENVLSSEFMESSPPRLWQWRLIAKSYFYLGKLEEALDLLQKHEKTKPAVDESSEASMSFVVLVRELLQLKSAGNEAFQAARHSEAIEYYSSALACNAESRPFAAICFCNRAAAYQALGQITDAIADCSLAIALDPSYAKAISRRATLHELIRDYGQAANDLNRLISLLQKQMQEKDNESRGVGRSSSNATDLKRARARLATVEEEARKGLSLNMYMILGIEPSSSSADVKKAYRKAALRHHPDKAGQFLVRNENVDELWREVAAEVHTDADRLFKMIGEAYSTLSDPTKRLQYDDEEEMRNCPIKGYNVSSPKNSSHYTYGSHHEKSFNRYHWRSHGSSHQS